MADALNLTMMTFPQLGRCGVFSLNVLLLPSVDDPVTPPLIGTNPITPSFASGKRQLRGPR